MKKNTFIKFFFAAVLSVMLFSCEKIDNIGKTDTEKLHEYINASDWQIDTIRTQTGDANGKRYVDNYTPFTSGKVSFSKITQDHGFTKGIMTRIVRINNKDSTIKTPYLMADATYIKLYYPNPNIGLSDISIIYTIQESSNNKFTFLREATLVSSTNGAAYGSSRSVFKLKK